MNGMNGHSARLLKLQDAALQRSESIRIGEVERIDAMAGLCAYAEQLGLPADDDTHHVIREGLDGRTTVQATAATPRVVAPAARDWRAGSTTAAALRSTVFTPLVYVLPGYVTEGVTILASKPKVGKSWLALDLCIAVAGNRITLGQIKPAQGDVLYLALEDSGRRLQSRLRKLVPHDVAWPGH